MSNTPIYTIGYGARQLEDFLAVLQACHAFEHVYFAWAQVVK